MFIHYMYADISFSLTKAIPIMFERVTTHYQTLQTWIGHAASLTWFGAICNALPHVTVKFMKNIYLYFLKKK